MLEASSVTAPPAVKKEKRGRLKFRKAAERKGGEMVRNYQEQTSESAFWGENGEKTQRRRSQERPRQGRKERVHDKWPYLEEWRRGRTTNRSAVSDDLSFRAFVKKRKGLERALTWKGSEKYRVLEMA